jgi:hypothetical protein
MVRFPEAMRSDIPTPEEAAAALEDAHRLGRRGWRLATGQRARLSLMWWGLAWMVTYASVQFLPVVPAVVIAAVAGVVAGVLTGLGERGDPTPASSGWEAQIGHAWYVLLGGAFLLDLIAAPDSITVAFLIPGAVWGIGLALYGVAARDRALLGLGAGVAILAAALRLLVPAEASLLFGLVAGGAMAALGALRRLRP